MAPARFWREDDNDGKGNTRRSNRAADHLSRRSDLGDFVAHVSGADDGSDLARRRSRLNDHRDCARRRRGVDCESAAPSFDTRSL